MDRYAGEAIWEAKEAWEEGERAARARGMAESRPPCRGSEGGKKRFVAVVIAGRSLKNVEENINLRRQEQEWTDAPECPPSKYLQSDVHLDKGRGERDSEEGWE